MRDHRSRTSGVERDLGGNQGASKGRIHISDDYHDVRLLRQKHDLELFHNLGSLHCMRSRTYAEMNIWLWKFKVAEERAGHEFVIVLAGMNEDVPDRFGRSLSTAGAICRDPFVVFANCRDDRCGFHEIGARANHSQDYHPTNP